MAEDKKKEDESSLKELFQKFSPSGKDSENQTVSFSSIQNFLKDANVSGQKFSEEDTSSILSNVAKSSKDSLNIGEFQQFIDQYASKLKMQSQELVTALKKVPSGGSGKTSFLDNIKGFMGIKKKEEKQ